MSRRHHDTTVNSDMRTSNLTRGKVGRAVLAGLLATSLAACDLKVTNPGPIQDKFLDDPSATKSVVAGADAALAYALNWVAYTGAYIAEETVPSGNGGNLFGAPDLVRQGILSPEDNNDHWSNAQKARYVAENALERLKGTLGDSYGSSEYTAQLELIAGYANRLLGENMCATVLDGGAPQDISVQLQRAEDHFSTAYEVAGKAGRTDIQNAAIAGRASVRVDLGDWAGAVADAKQVPDGFVWNQNYYFGSAWDDYNRFFWGNDFPTSPFRAHTVYGTWYDSYYTQSHDPRTPWGQNPDLPYGTSSGVVWHFEQKNDKIDSPIRLSSSREMQLILAENDLMNHDWQAALAKVNALRAAVGVDPWTASNETEAWVALKRERGIEMWLEGRRLNDLHRWHDAGTPGQVEDMTGRSLCFPISQTEVDTNPNIDTQIPAPTG